MANNTSFLKLSHIDILPNLSIRIPTVGEILDDEFNYYSIVTAFTATPFQYMVQLDDIGRDFTTVTEFELFKMLFPIYANSDLSILFGDKDLSDLKPYKYRDTDVTVLSNESHDIIIDELVYNDLANTLRKINLFDKVVGKPGNEHARAYLIQKEKAKQKKNAKKQKEPYLEKMVIALVNTSEFPYDYDSCMNLSIYNFNQSFKQILHKIDFDSTRIGIYAGTIDMSKKENRKSLSLIPDL